MQDPLSVKVSRTVFDGIHRAWASDPKGKLRYSIAGTAAMCKRLGEREAAEWVEKHDYAFGLGVWHGFHVDGEYPGDVDSGQSKDRTVRTKRKGTFPPRPGDVYEQLEDGEVRLIERGGEVVGQTGDAYEWPWNSHENDVQDSVIAAYSAATGGSPPPASASVGESGAPLPADQGASTHTPPGTQPDTPHAQSVQPDYITSPPKGPSSRRARIQSRQSRRPPCNPHRRPRIHLRRAWRAPCTRSWTS